VASEQPSSVLVEVVDAQGVIEVVGDGDASMLLLAGDGVAVGGGDDSGTVGTLAARAGPEGPTSAEVKSLVEWLADPDLSVGVRNGRVRPPDPDRLRPLLRLLRPGRYVMSADVPRRPPVVVERTTHWHEDRQDTLIPTDAWPPRNSATVRSHRRRIEDDGHRPAVVALFPVPDGDIGYVLDGHHKLAAYRQAGLSPLLLRLAPEHPFRPRLDELRRAEDAFPTDAAHLFGDLRDQALRIGPWAGWLAGRGLLDEAEAEYRTDLANLRRLIAKRSRTGDADLDACRVRMAATQHEYGTLLRRLGRTADAEEQLRSALAVRHRLLGEHHPATEELRRALRRPPP
jgi:hypothetical protein